MASDSASCIPTVDDKDVAISADLCAGSTAAGSTPVGEDVNCPLDGSDQTAAAAPAATDGVVSLPVVEDVPNKEKNPNLCGKGAKFCESVESDAAHHPVAVQQSQGGANFAPRSKRTSQPTDTPAFSPNNLPAGGFPAGVVHPWSSSGRGAQQIPPMPPPSMPPPNLYQPPIMIPTLVPNMHTLMAPFLPGMGPVAAPPGFVPPQTPCPPLTFPTPLSGPIGMPVPPVMMHKPPNLAMFPTVFPDGSVTSSQPSLMKQEQSAPLSPSPNARVTVGNALLAAQMWNEPPKFSCVLLSGIPAVGKTTMGRELVNELREDGLGWVFFSGADFIATATGKRAVWETTKEVFDALEKRLDELLEQQREKRDVKGLVIDKNVKNVEEIFYLAALLRSKQIPFVGIIGLEAENDDVLLERIGEGQEPREKLKYRRIIHSRIRRLAREAGMYHQVDATKSKQEVLHALRTKVLGCCAQPPHRDIQPDLHVDSTSISMVDSHAEYYAVVAKVSEC
uniref:Uncharacterized protein TCIL3000_9_1290 n=1 Tax=Trypanosoma congolense (strain IL3000) TaxID=1068625 RepID=G0UTL9_TRYCI|nr:unnamed protein product [Trypanosoma congolense IL3000]